MSGDVFVDQNIRMIDVCNWAIGAHPRKAVGTGGLKVRKDGGDICNHWAMVLRYRGDTRVTFNSVQFDHTFCDVGARLFGDKGMTESYYSGVAQIVGPQPWKWDN